MHMQIRVSASQASHLHVSVVARGAFAHSSRAQRAPPPPFRQSVLGPTPTRATSRLPRSRPLGGRCASAPPWLAATGRDLAKARPPASPALPDSSRHRGAAFSARLISIGRQAPPPALHAHGRPRPRCQLEEAE